jgi:hypothetical protein
LFLLLLQMFPLTKADGIQVTCEQMGKQCEHQGGHGCVTFDPAIDPV